MKTLIRRGYAALIFGAAVLCAASPVTSIAQDSAGASITGTVTDRGGRAVQNAAIVVENEAKKLVQRAVTDDQGHFSVSNLPAGGYDLDVRAAGFATATQNSYNSPQFKCRTLLFSSRLDHSHKMLKCKASRAPRSPGSTHSLKDRSIPKRPSPAAQLPRALLYQFLQSIC